MAFTKLEKSLAMAISLLFASVVIGMGDFFAFSFLRVFLNNKLWILILDVVSELEAAVELIM